MTVTPLLDSASEFLERSAGFRLDPAQRHRFDYWLRTTAAQRGVDVALLLAELIDGGPALQSALDELTVQETSFFRDRPQFDGLRDEVLPTLRSPITVWSAGCAWGHEPYSLAMVLAASGIPDWRVFASDISSRALRQTESGRYAEHALKGLTPLEKSRYLRKSGDQWEVIPELRERVHVFRHNIVRDPPPAEVMGVQVVFCRNVLIYFHRSGVLTALDRIADAMDPKGWLFLGYSESLWRVTERFRLMRLGKAFAYRQPEAGLAGELVDVEPPVSAGSEPAAPGATRRNGAIHAPSPSRSGAVATGRGALPSPSELRAPVPHARISGRAAPTPTPGCVDPSTAPEAILLAVGEAALEMGDAQAAIAALRKVVYLDPDQAIAHFQLGLAFELGADPAQARRAFSAARAALTRTSAAAEVALEGYQVEELTRFLDQRLSRLRS
ncbi:MAG: CheR family methyltransferase [Candidatus Dormibacteria bacterium]